MNAPAPSTVSRQLWEAERSARNAYRERWVKAEAKLDAIREHAQVIHGKCRWPEIRAEAEAILELTPAKDDA